MSTDDSKRKRNYIRRKKYLNESAAHIKSTLEFIAFVRRDNISDDQLAKMSLMHTQQIEAACWLPHLRLTSDNYQTLITAKTRELCRAITKKALPNFDIQQLQRLAWLQEKHAALKLTPPPTRSNTPCINLLPAPIIPFSMPQIEPMFEITEQISNGCENSQSLGSFDNDPFDKPIIIPDVPDLDSVEGESLFHGTMPVEGDFSDFPYRTL